MAQVRCHVSVWFQRELYTQMQLLRLQPAISPRKPPSVSHIKSSQHEAQRLIRTRRIGDADPELMFNNRKSKEKTRSWKKRFTYKPNHSWGISLFILIYFVVQRKGLEYLVRFQ